MNALNLNNSISAANSTGLQSRELDKSGGELGQSDFIELLVAQVKNQDPSKPMDPSQFMNQLAQFSTVNGIEELKNSFDSLATRLSSDQSLQAAGLLGRDVLIANSIGQLTATGTVNGRVNLPQQASEVSLKVFNEQGELVRSLPLGGHDQGPLTFQWDGLSDEGIAASPGKYQITVDALIDGNQQALVVELETSVESISLNKDGSGITLNLANGESVPLSMVQQIR